MLIAVAVASLAQAATLREATPVRAQPTTNSLTGSTGSVGRGRGSSQARPHASRLHDAADRFRHVVEPLAARLDPDRLLMHLHARSQPGDCGPSTRPRSLSCGRKRPLYSSEAQPSTR